MNRLFGWLVAGTAVALGLGALYAHHASDRAQDNPAGVNQASQDHPTVVDPAGQPHPLPPGWSVPDSGLRWEHRGRSWTVADSQPWNRSGRLWRPARSPRNVMGVEPVLESSPPAVAALHPLQDLRRLLTDSTRLWVPDRPLLDTGAHFLVPGAGSVRWTGKYFWSHADSLWAQGEWVAPSSGGQVEVLLPAGAIDHEGLLRTFTPRYWRIALYRELVLDSGVFRAILPLVLEGPPERTIPRVLPPRDATKRGETDSTRLPPRFEPRHPLVHVGPEGPRDVEWVEWLPSFRIHTATIPDSARILSRDSGITFTVDSVAPVSARLPLLPDSSARARMRPSLWDESSRWMAGELGTRSLVNTGISGHAFLDLFITAWNEHRPVRLSPDAVWMVLLEGLIASARAHPQTTRKDLVRHQEGKIPLLATLPASFPLQTGSRRSWELVAHQLLDSMDRHVVGRRHKDLQVRFTTTTPTRALAHRFRILDLYQEFFDYRGSVLCGIPWIHLEGSSQDWRTLREKALAMRTSTNSAWMDGLRPVLDAFVATSEGRPSRRFWSNFIRYSPPSGWCGSQPEVDGWIAAFFNTSWSPFRASNDPERPIPDHRVLPTVPVHLVPSDHGQVPFQLDQGGRRRDFLLVSGFSGIRQDRDGALAAEVGWSVWERKKARHRNNPLPPN